ncbi:MAG: VanZ family protein [Oscillospiraceae bacterium]|nr:VanZ family protein [Oscillospiraceae bacterium]
MRKNSDYIKIFAWISYAVGTLFFGTYAVFEIIPGFQLSTFGRLFLLGGCCLFLWLGGFLLAKQSGNNRPMRINLWIFIGLFLLLFATLTLFDPMWGRNGGFVIWNKELFGNYAENQLNLVPFKTIIQFFRNGTFRTFLVNIIGNLICLMPLGILLPLAFEKQRKTWFFLLTVSLVVILVEFLQFATLAGSCDIDDLILNVSGAFLIYIFTKNKEAFSFLKYIFLLEREGEI